MRDSLSLVFFLFPQEVEKPPRFPNFAMKKIILQESQSLNQDVLLQLVLQRGIHFYT